MKICKLLILTIIGFLLLLNINLVNAKSSDLFINHLSQMIYSDCYEKDIQIKKGYIVMEPNKEPVTFINWQEENTYPMIRRIIELLGNYEPFDNYFDGCEHQDGSSYTKGRNGCNILACEDRNLDINNYEYFWDGIRVDVPKEEFKTTYGPNSPIVETYGDKSPITTGDNSPINQNEKKIWIQLFWSKGTIVGAIIGFLLKILYDRLKNYKS